MKHDRGVRWLCAAVFLVAAVAVVWFFHLFVQVDGTMEYVEWESSVKVMEDGTEIPFSPEDTGNVTDAAGTYRFTGRLAAGHPAGSLLFETSGLELSVTLDGSLIWQSRSGDSGENGIIMAQASIPLAEHTAGELVVDCTVLDSASALFPPLLRFVPDSLETTQDTAIANQEAFPAGAAALAFLLAIGIFLTGILIKKPDVSLIPLIFAAAGLTFFRLVQSQGYYFLPEKVYHVLSRPEIGLFILLALLLYCAMNRRRRFWKQLGAAALASAAAFLICYLVSLWTGGYVSRLVKSLAEALIQRGYYDSIVYWLTLWLTLASVLISAYGVARSFASQQAQTQSLLLKERLMEKNYHELEEQMAQTAASRHELNHQLTAMELLCRKNDLEGVENVLKEMQVQQRTACHPFTVNQAVNTILQDANQRAKRKNIRFYASVSLPESLNIPEPDLCTLLMNMLDNAIEAAEKVESPDRRFVSIHLKIHTVYLAVKCENSFTGEIRKDKKGGLVTTKEPAAAHGFGYRQMEQVAKKYHSILRHEIKKRNLFVVETALRIPD